MPYITSEILAQAIPLARKLNLQDKEKICDEIFKAQPHLLGSVLTLHRLSVSLEKRAGPVCLDRISPSISGALRG